MPKDWSSKPRVVTPKDVEASISALRARGEVDVDRFLEAIDPRTIVHSPLGPTDDCLSVEGIALISESRDFLSDSNLAALSHLNECVGCMQNYLLYMDIKSDSQTDNQTVFVSRRDSMHTGGPLRIGQEDYVELVLSCRKILSDDNFSRLKNLKISGRLNAQGYEDLKFVSTLPTSPSLDFYYLRVKPFWSLQDDNQSLPPLHEPFCDVVTLSGTTESGQAFSGRSVLPFVVLSDNDEKFRITRE